MREDGELEQLFDVHGGGSEEVTLPDKLSHPPTALQIVPAGQQPYIQQMVPIQNISNVVISMLDSERYSPAPQRLC